MPRDHRAYVRSNQVLLANSKFHVELMPMSRLLDTPVSRCWVCNRSTYGLKTQLGISAGLMLNECVWPGVA